MQAPMQALHGGPKPLQWHEPAAKCPSNVVSHCFGACTMCRIQLMAWQTPRLPWQAPERTCHDGRAQQWCYCGKCLHQHLPTCISNKAGLHTLPHNSKVAGTAKVLEAWSPCFQQHGTSNNHTLLKTHSKMSEVYLKPLTPSTHVVMRARSKTGSGMPASHPGACHTGRLHHACTCASPFTPYCSRVCSSGIPGWVRRRWHQRACLSTLTL